MDQVTFIEIIEKIAVQELIKSTYESISDYLAEVNKKLLSTKDELNGSLEMIYKDALNWSGLIKSIDLYGSGKNISSHYISLDFYVTPLRYLIDSPTEINTNLISYLSEDSNKNLVLFGGPGMGKTTSMKMVTHRLIYDEDFLAGYFPIPLVIRLREIQERFSQEDLELNSKNILFLFIFDFLDIRYEEADPKIKDYYSRDKVVRNIVLRVIENLNILIIIDGFDEIEYAARDNLIAQIKEISYKTNSTKIIVTARTGEFAYNIENFEYIQIAPLSRTQIESFVSKWLGKNRQQEFMLRLEKSPYMDTAIRPLILSFLCSIYEFNGELPLKPKFIYREIIDLLLSRWDRQRGFGRKSKFDGFDRNRKLDFIVYLAFELLLKSKFFFSKGDLQGAYSNIASEFGLDKFQYQEVIEEIEEHSGLFIQSGVDKFQFPHKSLQEFLASEYLVRYYPLSDFSEKIVDLSNELAIVISLSPNPNNKLIEVLELLSSLEVNQIKDFLNTFLNRLESEQIFFKSDYKTAYCLTKAIKEMQLQSYDIFLRIYSLEGIDGCFEALENHFIYESWLLKDIMDYTKERQIPGKDDLIKLNSKDGTHDEIFVYFKFLENWRYIKPNLPHNSRR